MSPDSYCTLMAEYNQWMNRSLYAGCAQLSDEQRKRDMGAFFQSIHGTLNHLLYTDKVWMGRFLCEPFSSHIEGHELYRDYEELRAERAREDARIVR